MVTVVVMGVAAAAIAQLALYLVQGKPKEQSDDRVRGLGSFRPMLAGIWVFINNLIWFLLGASASVFSPEIRRALGLP